MSEVHQGNMQHRLATTLCSAAERLRTLGLAREASRFEVLAGEVNQPALLAVVGRVKAGKSTFINALLRKDLAKTGATETTATINYFRYGQPADPAKPVVCYWRTGQSEKVDRAFLDSLQGNDPETLRRSHGIDRLEYHVQNRYLEHVTLVDTPGTGAVLAEHQERTDEFMGMLRELRERHDQQTHEVGSKADAIIYLVGQVARTTDQAFLEAFGQMTQGEAKALNAIGVMAKIDLDPELLRRSPELAAKIADQLKENVNTVVPVSAGIRRFVDRLTDNDQAGLDRMMRLLRAIPAEMLEVMLRRDVRYLSHNPACPVSVDERRTLLGEEPWQVFTTAARIAADPALSRADVVVRLEELAGFGRLEQILEQRFFSRAAFLKAYRVLNDARHILRETEFTHLRDLRRRERDDKLRLDRFVAFIQQAGGDAATGRELEGFVRRHLTGHSALEPTVKAVSRDVSRLFHEMEEHNLDFESLQQLQDHGDEFSSAELEELRPLLGLSGLETEHRVPPGCASVDYVGERQRYWLPVSRLARRSVRREVAQRTVDRYGLILQELSQ